jgi:molecular chaperone DnaK
MEHAIGIDLGTTYCATAIVRSGDRPEVLWNREGDHLTPSAVLFQDGGQVLVGKTAKNAAKDMPDDCVQFVKRQIGNSGWSFADSRGEIHGAEEISALILKRLAEDAAETLGEPVRNVVITVPAYFDDARRKATRDAGEIAGLTVLRLINEPTAAGIAFGTGSTSSGTLFVYDLGGGTFDVTVMRIKGSDLEVLATSGDRNLGGFDFDNRLMAHIAQEVTAQAGPDLQGDGRLEAELREKSEQAKHALTRTAQTKLFFSDAGKNYSVEVTREQFEKLTDDLLIRTADISEEVLEEAQLTWAGIDRILLVGGSTKMPMVREMLQRLSGKAPDTTVNPDEAVALGAAIVADIEMTKLNNPHAEVAHTIQDVTSQGLGIIVVDDDLVTEYNSIIIPKNSKIPCKENQVYGTTAHHQRKLKLRVTEGDEDDIRFVNMLVERPIDLPDGLPKHAPLEVIMSYDIDGVVHIEIIDRTNNRSLGEVELDRPRNLDASQVKSLSTEIRKVDLQ